MSVANLHEISALIVLAITAVTAHLRRFSPRVRRCRIMYQTDATNEAWQKCENLRDSSSAVSQTFALAWNHRRRWSSDISITMQRFLFVFVLENIQSFLKADGRWLFNSSAQSGNAKLQHVWKCDKECWPAAFSEREHKEFELKSRERVFNIPIMECVWGHEVEFLTVFKNSRVVCTSCKKNRKFGMYQMMFREKFVFK